MAHDSEMKWRFAGLYGYSKTENKPKMGHRLKNLFRGGDDAWVCGGDLNLMLWSMEKKGGNKSKFEEAAILRDVMDHCKLEDLHYVGYPFTWTNNQGGEKNVQERLDRFMANEK